MEKGKHRYFTVISHGHIKDLDFWDEDLACEIKCNAEMRAREPTGVLLSIANIKPYLSEIEKMLEKSEHLVNIESFRSSAESLITERFGGTVVNLIMLDWPGNEEFATIAEAKEWFAYNFEKMSSLATKFCWAISSDLNKEESGSRIATIINTVSSTRFSDILYVPMPAVSTVSGEIVYCDCFSADSAADAIYLCFVLLVREKKQIRCCKVCGRFFVPSTKINEIYCKDCRKTTYDTKIKLDEILSAYRTIYKTQNARKQRNLHRPCIIERFEQWKKYAKMKLQQCQNQDITLDEMRTAISSDDWIYGFSSFGGINHGND